MNRKNQATILIVEDDANLLAVMEKALSSAGFYVIATTSATKAWGLIETDCFSAFISDFDLKDRLSGFDLIRFCKSRKTVPCFLVTGLFFGESDLKNAGVDKYFCKPFALYELVLPHMEVAG